MSAPSVISKESRTKSPAQGNASHLMVWLVAVLGGVAFAWPLLIAALFHGRKVMLRSLTGDSYHYLAIARKANLSHLYTYDGVHVTNGFHPLWQYTIRGMFYVFGLQSHESQGVAVVLLALGATTLGVILTIAAVVRLTKEYFLGLLVVPGLYYLVVGVHVRNLWIWTALEGMESAFSILFGGVFFFVLSYYVGSSANREFRPVEVYRALGFVMPFLILSRLDDVFLLPAFLIALVFFEMPLRDRLVAGAWASVPSVVAISCYMAYNKLTVGVPMPLSGATKAGFVGFLTAYLTAAIHFPPLLYLKAFLTHKASEGEVVFGNSFRFVAMIYPLLASIFGALAIWKYRRKQLEFSVFLALCLYIIFKMSYNFLNVHPWHQANWYYAFAILCLSVLGALVLREPWIRLGQFPIAAKGVMTIYVMLMLLSASQYYAGLVYQSPESAADHLWERKSEIRQELLAQGVHGLINVDDGITAFLLDFPNMHGFAFATDIEAQRAYMSGRMLSLAYARGINGITGLNYMEANSAPQSDAEIREYLRKSLAGKIMRSEIDQFDFSLAYYDPVLKLPFILFRPKVH
jgi:hypothetical protein